MTTAPAARDPRRQGWGHRLTVALSVMLLGLAAVGCANLANLATSTIEGFPMAAATSTTTLTPTVADCNNVNYPLIDIPQSTRGETTMTIPQPPGREDITEMTVSPEGVTATLSAKVLMAAAESENKTHGLALIVATTEPDNPTYQRDSQAILDGFVFLPSDSRW